MARRATGKVIEPDKSRKSYALRFTAYGKRRYVNLGRPDEGWTLSKAQAELRHVLADVERGIWTPSVPAPEPVAQTVPIFHVFASEWLAAREPELSERTVRDYRWALVEHLLPFFKDHLLTSITIQEVDRYKTFKVREGRLSNNSVNKTLTRLSMVLEVAVEYGYITANPAAGRRRRLKRTAPNRPHVEPEQLPALLDAAGKLGTEEKPSEYRTVGKALLTTLAGTGLRIGEALDLQWRDVNLSSLTLKVRASKTDAGVREVDLSPAVASVLKALKADRSDVKATDPVFGSYHYGRDDRSRPAKLDRHRVRERILKPSVKAANRVLEDKGIEPMGNVTLHGLRRTFASLKFANGDDPVYVAEQLGHTDPTFSMRVYARAVKRESKLSGDTLEAFKTALQLAQIGTEIEMDGLTSLDLEAADSADSALPKGFGGRARQDSNLRPHAPEACALSS